MVEAVEITTETEMTILVVVAEEEGNFSEKKRNLEKLLMRNDNLEQLFCIISNMSMLKVSPLIEHSTSFFHHILETKQEKKVEARHSEEALKYSPKLSLKNWFVFFLFKWLWQRSFTRAPTKT